MKHISLLAAAALLSLSNATSNTSSTNSTSPALLSSGTVQLGIYADAYIKAKALISQLSNSDKLAVITGSDVSATNASWTALAQKDGFAGVNYQYYVSSFLMGNALAMTWDRDHIYNQAKATGREFYLLGYNLIAGPVAGQLGRTPYGGRQPEAFSPDPYLTGLAIGQAIKGMSAAGVVASGRHFLLNEQETNRTSPYTSNADDKTTHELYLWPFADAVRAGMGAVMCAMTEVNGTLACETDHLINGLLKEELGFPGLVYPDVNGQSSAFGSADAGLDYGGSTYWSNSTLIAGIANGTFSQDRLDDMAIRNVIGYYQVGLDDGKQPSKAAATDYRNVRADHAKLIRRAGADSIVLLKNDALNGLGLPLTQPRTISIFGVHAGPCVAGPNQAFSVQGTTDSYQGHLATAGGSGQLSFSYLATPYQALSVRAAADGFMLNWILNDTYSGTSSSNSMGGGMPSMGGNSSSFGVGSSDGPSSSNGNSSISANGPGGAAGGGGGGLGNLGQGTAVTPSFSNYASSSGVCLVFLNAGSGEGADRSELTNSDGDALVNTIAANCNNTIVVINTVGPRLVEQWIDNDNVTAVIYGGLLGQESGNAIADVLFGDVNPSGKLIHTIAKNESDYPVKICETTECDFTEGVHIDYRYFDAQNKTVRYPFGHGLSYTTFNYSAIAAEKTDVQALSSTYPTGPLALGGNSDLFDEVISVSIDLANSGTVDGAEVAQLYVSYPDSAQQPVRQLRGFEKLVLGKGESQKVTFSIRRRDVSHWDVVAQKWAIAKGTYTFAVGSSSRDLRIKTTVEI